jgi:hypothetical protein
LEALCKQLIQGNRQLRERVNLLEWAMGPAADDMNIETDRVGIEKPKEGFAQEDYLDNESRITSCLNGSGWLES